jgi:hypothetical protein
MFTLHMHLVVCISSYDPLRVNILLSDNERACKRHFVLFFTAEMRVVRSR